MVPCPQRVVAETDGLPTSFANWSANRSVVFPQYGMESLTRGTRTWPVLNGRDVDESARAGGITAVLCTRAVAPPAGLVNSKAPALAIV
jgi:hypothetical protein